MNIIETKTLNVLIHESKKLDKNSAVIFDINQVLIKEESSIFNLTGRVCRERMSKTVWKDLTPKEVTDLWSLILLNEPVHLVDPQIPNIIRSLQKQSVKVMAQTSCPVGRYGHIECLTEWSINRLAQHDIQFCGVFAEHDPLELTIKTEQQSGTALFKKGILFNSPTYRFSKGNILQQFFEQINWEPNLLIFVDNQLGNLESIGNLAQKLSIEFLGILFTAVLEQQNAYDEKLAQFQCKYLKDNNIWLPDSRASKFIHTM